jgi:aldose 1-epimerase
MMRINFILIAVFILNLNSCNTDPKADIEVYAETWGEVDGQEVKLYTLTNSNGMVIKLTNYGAILTSVVVPDREGNFEDVVLGFDNLEQYLGDDPCFGATIGRFVNRIRNARFTIGDSTYILSANDKGHCIHGGINGFHTKVWDNEVIQNDSSVGVQFHYFSKDNEEGFPGNLHAFVTYTLNDSNEIAIHFKAETDQPTHVNFTHHSYFNLTGLKDKIFDHLVKIDADQTLEIDEDIVPTGNLLPVKTTIRDLNKLTRIGENIFKMDHKGYHFCYVFKKATDSGDWVIEVREPVSGRKLEVYTTQPGVQFYTGNSIGDRFTGKYGIQYGDHDAFCLETQHFPDTPNHENFPSTLLLPGDLYNETVIYKFSVDK